MMLDLIIYRHITTTTMMIYHYYEDGDDDHDNADDVDTDTDFSIISVLPGCSVKGYVQENTAYR